MSRVCAITGKKKIFGNNVSHANNKTRRTFNPNTDKRRFYLNKLNLYITIVVSARGIRTIHKFGGIDALLSKKTFKPYDAKLHKIQKMYQSEK